jgi:hypothetical protein
MMNEVPTGTRPQIPPTFAKCVVSGTTQGHRWAQVFYLALTGSGVTSTDLESLCDSIKAAWTTSIAPQLEQTCILTGVQITYIPSAGNEVIGVKAYSQAGGISTGPIQDAGASAVVSWKIGAYYRGGHPRSYVTGVPAAKVTTGSALTSAYVTSLTAAWEAFRVALNTMTATHVTSVIMGTISFARDKAWRVTPLFFPYQSVLVSPTLGSQRRRIRA